MLGHCGTNPPMSHPSQTKSEKSRARSREPWAPLPSLVAVELGSEFPAWISLLARSGEFRVVAEHEGEGSTTFTARVLAAAAELSSGATGLSRAVLVCNERTDEHALTVRHDLARRIFDNSAPARKPSIVLAASSRASARLRQSLSELAARIPGTPTIKIDEEPVQSTVANVA